MMDAMTNYLLGYEDFEPGYKVMMEQIELYLKEWNQISEVWNFVVTAYIQFHGFKNVKIKIIFVCSILCYNVVYYDFKTVIPTLGIGDK